MKQSYAILWKTWRELRWFVIGGWALFIIPGLLDAWHYSQVEEYHRFTSSLLGGPSMALADMIAILIAMALTCTDLSYQIQTFWASRPIRNFRFLSLKFLCGLAALWLLLIVPGVLQIFLDYRASSLIPGSIPYPNNLTFYLSQYSIASALYTRPWSVMLVYACAFLLGVAVRRAVPAAMLAIAAGLLVYFVPMIVPGLHFLDSFHWFDLEHPVEITPFAINRDANGQFLPGSSAGAGEAIIAGIPDPVARFIFRMLSFTLDGQWYHIELQPAFILYALSMTALSVVVFFAALWFLRRNKTFSLDLRTMCWSLGGATLLLFFGGTYDFRSTLQADWIQPKRIPPPQGISLQKDAFVYCAVANPQNPMKLAFYHCTLAQNSVDPDPVRQPQLIYEIVYGNIQNLPMRQFWCWDAQRNLLYIVVGRYHSSPNQSWSSYRDSLELQVVSFDPSALQPSWQTPTNGHPPAPVAQGKLIGKLNLDSTFPLDSNSSYRSDISNQPHIFFKNNRLYLTPQLETTNHYAIVDMNIPTSPTLLHSGQSDIHSPLYFNRQIGHLNIPEWLHDLSPQDQIEALRVLHNYGWNDDFAVRGDILCSTNRENRQDGLLVSRLVSAKPSKNSVLGYQAQILGAYDQPLIQRIFGFYTMKLLVSGNVLYALERCFSPRIAAYDISDPRHIKRIGYYNAPGDSLSDIALLPDNRLLAAGQRFHILKHIP